MFMSCSSGIRINIHDDAGSLLTTALNPGSHHAIGALASLLRTHDLPEINLYTQHPPARTQNKKVTN